MASKIQLLIVTCSWFTALIAAENVTTVFQLHETSSGDFESSGTWSVVATGSARGLPLRKGQQGLGNVWAGQACCEGWTGSNWVKLGQTVAASSMPPLTQGTFESAKFSNEAEAGGGPKITLDNAKVWRGPFPPVSRARLHFVPPKSKRATLGIFLCEPEDVADIQCVAIVVSGSSYDSKLLRFQTTRYGSRQSGPRRPTPNGYLKTLVQSRDDRVLEGWLGDIPYNFHIERTFQGDLEIRLEEGDLSQRRSMTISAPLSYNRLAISLLPSTSDAEQFQVKDDPAWYGELAPGGSTQVDFTPSSSGSGHLGFSFCEDRFQERCSSIVFDGFSDGKAIPASNPPYWTAGSEDVSRPMPRSSTNAKWNPVQQRRFSVNRAHDGNVNIAVSGDPQTYTLAVPPTYQYLVIENHRGEGSMNVVTKKESLSADVWQLTETEGVLRSPPIAEWFAQKDICVSIVTRVSKGSTVIVAIQRIVDGEGKRVGQIRGSDDEPGWVKKRLTLPRSLILQNQKVSIVVNAQQPARTTTPVLLQWTAACDPHNKEDRIILNGLSPVSSVINNGGFQTIETPERQTLPPMNNSVCTNEGLLDMENSRCICRPGFTGKLCEKGCGRNRFGDNCESRCSADSSARQCRGTWLCTARFPCDCAPGLTGPRCDKVCPNGFYGIGCRQTCGQCSFDQTCDPYTGWCTTGCKGGLQPPFCKNACGTDKNATSLISFGTQVTAEKYPWHVAIFDKEYKDVTGRTNATTIENICGGTVLTPLIVVSVAHCFHNDNKIPPEKYPAFKYQVAFGKTNRGWDVPEEHNERVQRRSVLVIHSPEFFSGRSRSLEDDLAILELDAPLVFTPYVSPICFDYTGNFEEPLVSGAVGRVAGWGHTEGGNPSEVLKDATLPFLPLNDCLKLVPFSFRPYASARDHFCAGEQGAYVDRGDSGGGFIFADSRSGAWYLRGAVSSRPPNVVQFAAYTNVSYHRDFILRVIQQAELRNAQNNYWRISAGKKR